MCLALCIDQEAFHEGRTHVVVDKLCDFDGDGLHKTPIFMAWLNVCRWPIADGDYCTQSNA